MGCQKREKRLNKIIFEWERKPFSGPFRIKFYYYENAFFSIGHITIRRQYGSAGDFCGGADRQSRLLHNAAFVHGMSYLGIYVANTRFSACSKNNGRGKRQNPHPLRLYEVFRRADDFGENE